MTPAARTLKLIAGLGAILSCNRGTPLAGAFVVRGGPVHVGFRVPITPAGPERSLCLSFDPPGDSHRAADLTIVLLTATGERDTLRGRAERAGEAVVCVRDTSSIAPGRTYTGAEFSAPTEVRTQALTWGARLAQQ